MQSKASHIHTHTHTHTHTLVALVVLVFQMPLSFSVTNIHAQRRMYTCTSACVRAYTHTVTDTHAPSKFPLCTLWRCGGQQTDKRTFANNILTHFWFSMYRLLRELARRITVRKTLKLGPHSKMSQKLNFDTFYKIISLYGTITDGPLPKM